MIVNAGYLVRSVYIQDVALHIDGDLNATVPIQVIGAPSTVKTLHFNSDKLAFTIDPVTGDWSSTLTYAAPVVSIPDLSSLAWKTIDNLPEIQPAYDDLPWVSADKTTTNNTVQPLLTPTSLFSGDYGFTAGVVLYRGHFTATGSESTIYLDTQGGAAFGSSVWLNSTYVGSWTGTDAGLGNNSTYTLPNLVAGKNYVLTVVVDNNGLHESWVVGTDEMKTPVGIINYALGSRDQTAITWKITGNLGGEQYVDKVSQKILSVV